MRELDTASPVIWPAWCYSGDKFERERGGAVKKKSRDNFIGGCGGGGGGSVVGGMTTIEGGGVKSERLSPSSSAGGGVHGVCDTGSSRSGTPSSSCTPPRQGGSPSQPPLPLTRNYSDFMRSLAAKYNNNNSTAPDFLSGRNGFSGLKPGTSPPFPGLLPPPAITPGGGKTEDKHEPTAPPLFLPGVPPVFPPVIDLNATQALLNMVRTQQQLENYLKGASSKRDASNTPLDLSASAARPPPVKKPKKSLSESLYGSDILPLLRNNKRGASGLLAQARRQAAKVVASSGTPASTTMATPLLVASSPPSSCYSSCQDKPCTPDSQTISHWTVEDVAGFVASVDMCSEYTPNFREQRIDGSALAMLTEEHLTTALGMKLGPALKLRSILSSRLGQCAVCRHCTHCHGGGVVVVNPLTTPLSTGSSVVGATTSTSGGGGGGGAPSPPTVVEK